MKFQLMVPGVADGEKLRLLIDGEEYDVVKHTPETLREAREYNAALAVMTEDRLADIGYYADAGEDRLKAGAGFERRIHRLQIVGVSKGDDKFSLPKLYHNSFFIPSCHKKRFLKEEALKGNSPDVYWDSKLDMCGAGLDRTRQRLAGRKAGDGEIMSGLERINMDIDLVLTPMDIAKTLLFHHPDLANAQPYTAAVVMNRHIAPPVSYDRKQYQRLLDFATAIGSKGPDGWARRDYAWNDRKKEAMTYEYDVLGHKAGDKVEIYDLDEDVLKKAGDPLKGALNSASQDSRLQNQTWHLNHGRAARRQEHRTQQMMERKKSAAASVSGKGARWTVKEGASMCGIEVKDKTLKVTEDTFKVDVLNSFLRTLAAYVEYLDDSGKPMGGRAYNRIVGPVSTIMGIPIPAGGTTIEAELPKTASGIKLYFGGLGTSAYDSDLCATGIALTAIFQMGIPSFFLAADAGLLNTRVLTDALKDRIFVEKAAKLLISIIQPPISSQNTEEIIYGWLKLAAKTIGGILVESVFEEILIWIIGQITAQEAAACIPVAGWVLRMANVAIDAAMLLETTIEVCASPAVMTAEITRSMNLKAVISPDPKHGEKEHPETAIWPATAHSWQMNLSYKGGTTDQITGTFGQTSSNEAVTCSFTGKPAGGSLRMIFTVYTKNGWICGRWDSGWKDALPDKDQESMQVEGSIEEFLIPLTRDVQYGHKEKLAYENGSYQWKAGELPIGTAADLGRESGGRCLYRLGTITYNSAYKQTGYVWSAAQEDGKGKIAFMIQNISTLSAEQVNKRFKESEAGFTEEPCVVYDKFGQGEDNFILDNRTGQCHLRKVELMDGTHGFGLLKTAYSYGRFQQMHLDDLVIHPSGSVIGINWETNKIEVLKLPQEGCMDGDAPQSQILSGEGFREGLINGPKAVKIASDGRILILESGNRRIQGFDESGNPVAGFQGRLLFDTPLAPIRKDLDGEVFTDTLEEAFRNAGLTRLCDTVDAGFSDELDESTVSEAFIKALSDKGIYLYSEEGNLQVQTVENKKQWRICETQRNRSYVITKSDTSLIIWDGLEQMNVTVVEIGRHWLLEDMDSGKSYVVYQHPQDRDTAVFYENLSYMNLWNGPQDDTYLDFCTDEKGYLYVLSYHGSGSKVSDYHVDIYNPDGSFLVRTPDSRLQPESPQYINAGRLESDEFRNLYTLNFETITGHGGKTEPSVSRWMPTSPMFTMDREDEAFLDAGDMGKVRARFKENNIELSGSARLLKKDDMYQIEDIQSVDKVSRPVVFDIIFCVDKYYVYMLLRKEEDIWKVKM